MYKKRFSLPMSIINFLVCLLVLSLLYEDDNYVKAQTPQAFLNPIYYGSTTVNAVFDHNLPLLSLERFDDPDCVQHNDGSSCLENPPYGLGYDRHDGIDYGLKYKPILPAANGIVVEAGWSDPQNHRYGLGLRIKINHDNDYKTEYGHLSVIMVKTEQSISVDPNNRQSIIGISGNTGYVEGYGCDPDSDPLCGGHLHFGLINSENVRVNPYGWQGSPIPDPWEYDSDGAPSYDLWVQYPAIEIVYPLTELQYPTGSILYEPNVNNQVIVVDDSNPSFSDYGDCWTVVNAPDAINGSYHTAPVERVDVNNPPPPTCYAEWVINSDDIETPPGEYDVYVHVLDQTSTLSAFYTIQHNGKTDEAIIVQAAYPNGMHDTWVYAGRYDFAINSSTSEYIRVSNQTITDTISTDLVIVADAIRLHPPFPNEVAYVSQGSDDAGPNPLFQNDCSDYWIAWPEIYLGHCQDGSPIVSGFRFQDVTIPDGATIIGAQLVLTVDGPGTAELDIQIQGELADNAETFDDTNRPSNRSPLTDASTTWHISSEDEWIVGQTCYSPDLSDVVQEVTDQPGWVSGNAIVIIVQPTTSGTTARRVFAWEREYIIRSARLQIWYTETPPPTPPPAPTNLKAIYDDGMPGPGLNVPIPEAPIPMPHVDLSWKPMLPEAGITYNVYRNTTSPVPIDVSHRIASGLDKGAYDDYDGQVGDYYVVTAFADSIESDPSNTARAR